MARATAGLLVTLFLLLVLAAGGAAWSRPGALAPPVAVATTAPPTSASPAPTSPVGPLPPASPPPSTIPLTTKGQSSHISPVFAILSGVGAAVAALILAIQWVLTRPGRRRQWTL